MPADILYCGDTTLTAAGSYLAGVLQHHGLAFDYRASHEPLRTGDLDPCRTLCILSDYPAAHFDVALQRRLLEQVAAGAGLLMIGGWESFHGHGGNWNLSPIAEALPVEIMATDDRINCDHPALLRATQPHPITSDLPWDEHPPTIGGFNRITPRHDAQVLLEVDRCAAVHGDAGWSLNVIETHPLLIVGNYGAGRTAALATDVAPHWVGGLVDWGTGRVTAHAPGAEPIEVGDRYAQFLGQLVSWVKGEST
ncbi:MAG: glutamine amidotransferase [Planctomycetaceae bacterium]